MTKSRILIDKDQDKENFPPLSTTPIAKRATNRLVLKRSFPFEIRIEKVPDFV